MRHVVVREYARITTASVESTLDQAQVSESAFDWLCRESARLRETGANLVQIESRRMLRLDNYVGVLETPCHTRIEILPKVSDADDIKKSRRTLRRMLSACLDLPSRTSTPTDIEAFDSPLTEWVISEFLKALRLLVKRGVRFDYRSVREEQRFLRGRLDMAQQLRQPPGRQHVFNVEHDIFDVDRAENRLLRSALDKVCAATRDAANWRLSHELSSLLSAVPHSVNVEVDFRRWRNDRLLAHYKSVRPWTALILGERSPIATLGAWHGASLLFPMERVFERYVEACLRRALPSDVTLRRQVGHRHLAQHAGADWFTLRPDLHLSRGNDRWVLDTKWKRIDGALANPSEKYGLSQADFYQMFAYGQKYQGGSGDLYLVYPRTSAFDTGLQVFELAPLSRLWVVPFDLDTGLVVGPRQPFLALTE